ncbi:uncharacterized protein LTR77_010951 [Saxophila tyrrhenica]|uniref:Uncharacterized protein n=1 Tax=Saxophila tyrrhenica TaxID=1690608 RepID=A0AAV9NUD6_9PEZI|nr:hypothetical protein LTR77_010951 [Saxophila tyrrhenica]
MGGVKPGMQYSAAYVAAPTGTLTAIRIGATTTVGDCVKAFLLPTRRNLELFQLDGGRLRQPKEESYDGGLLAIVDSAVALRIPDALFTLSLPSLVASWWAMQTATPAPSSPWHELDTTAADGIPQARNLLTTIFCLVRPLEKVLSARTDK